MADETGEPSNASPEKPFTHMGRLRRTTLARPQQEHERKHKTNQPDQNAHEVFRDQMCRRPANACANHDPHNRDPQQRPFYMFAVGPNAENVRKNEHG